ncbi:hypothetical protein DKP78_19835, partial [Enterococcus faecium]
RVIIFFLLIELYNSYEVIFVHNISFISLCIEKAHRSFLLCERHFLDSCEIMQLLPEKKMEGNGQSFALLAMYRAV